MRGFIYILLIMFFWVVPVRAEYTRLILSEMAFYAIQNNDNSSHTGEVLFGARAFLRKYGLTNYVGVWAYDNGEMNIVVINDYYAIDAFAGGHYMTEAHYRALYEAIRYSCRERMLLLAIPRDYIYYDRYITQVGEEIYRAR